MMLYANGQDIKQIVFANLEKELSLENIKVYQTGPEGYLNALVSFLEHEGVDIKQVKKIFVVVGPGSATALRGSLSVFNTLGFALGVELFEVKKDSSEQDIGIIKKILEQGLSSYKPVKVLKPIYEHEARITMSTKDILRRRTNRDII